MLLQLLLLLLQVLLVVVAVVVALEVALRAGALTVSASLGPTQVSTRLVGAPKTLPKTQAPVDSLVVVVVVLQLAAAAESL